MYIDFNRSFDMNNQKLLKSTYFSKHNFIFRMAKTTCERLAIGKLFNLNRKSGNTKMLRTNLHLYLKLCISWMWCGRQTKKSCTDISTPSRHKRLPRGVTSSQPVAIQSPRLVRGSCQEQVNTESTHTPYLSLVIQTVLKLYSKLTVTSLANSVKNVPL